MICFNTMKHICNKNYQKKTKPNTEFITIFIYIYTVSQKGKYISYTIDK